MPSAVRNPALHRFALFSAAATLVLVCIGGLVTSHGVGMAVPDWPNTYGYNMFFFPFSQWVGGIFYEHSHRLVASGVGLLTTVLAVWLHGRKARPWLRWGGLVMLSMAVVTWAMYPRHWADGIVSAVAGLAAFGVSWLWPRCEPAAPWLRRFGLALFLAVVLQGVLGGLRVVLLKNQLGIFHATLAQLFFAGMCALALFTSRWWAELEPQAARYVPSSLRILLTGTTLLILLQLVLGATMRHQHAGLSIPDFPTAYGKVWPAIDPASVAHYNQQRLEVLTANPITAFQILLQMVHRLVALLILLAVAACALITRRVARDNKPLQRLTLGWLGLILLQVLLGAATIWSNKAADIATAHVLVGALSLAMGVQLILVAERQAHLLAAPAKVRSNTASLQPLSDFSPRPAHASGVE